MKPINFQNAYLVLELTNVCNLNCDHCVRNQDAVHLKKQGFMSFDLIKSVIQDIKENEGGIIAPLAANQTNDVSFIVLLASTGILGSELSLIQSKTLRPFPVPDEDAYEKAIRKAIKIAAFVTADKEIDAKTAGAEFVGGEELIEKIKKTEKTDFQVAVAEPAMMRHLGKIAKILGTRGLMPSPKNETVTSNVAKTIEELKKGKISFKNDDTGNIHIVIGKVSFIDQQLLENYKTI
jgi:hypothetical protein